MIAPETEAMFVARFLQREATSKQTIALRAQEKERGNDWVVPSEVVGCTEIIAVCREIEDLRRERDAIFREGFKQGFLATGEGWNAEYPFEGRDVECSIPWKRTRDRAASAWGTNNRGQNGA